MQNPPGDPPPLTLGAVAPELDDGEIARARSPGSSCTAGRAITITRDISCSIILIRPCR